MSSETVSGAYKGEYIFILFYLNDYRMPTASMNCHVGRNITDMIYK